MIVCDGFNVVHVQKTGGTYIRHVLGAVKDPDLENASPSFDESIPHFGFIRNPFDWYRSYYNFILNGSDMYPDHHEAAYCITFGSIDFTFSEFVKQMTHPEKGFREKLLKSMMKHSSHGSMRVNRIASINHWINYEGSYLSSLYDAYLSKCTAIGKIENVKTDLKEMLVSIGKYTDEIDSRLMKYNKPINVGLYDNRSSHTTETIQLISSADSLIIGKHCYESPKI